MKISWRIMFIGCMLGMIKRIKNNIIISVIIITMLIMGWYIYKKTDCLKIIYLDWSHLLKHNKKEYRKIVVIYNFSICGTCPSGKFLLSIKGEKEYLFILSPELKDEEIDNFKDMFGIKNPIMKGNKRIESLLKKISNCYGKEDWKSNYLLEYDAKGKLKFIRFI